MEFSVVLWVNSGLKQGKKYVLQHLGKICDQLLWFENVTETQKVAPDHYRDYCVLLHLCLALTRFWGLESSSSCLESAFCGEWTTWRDCPTLLDRNRRWKALAPHAGTYSPPGRGPLPVEGSESKCADPSQHYSLCKLPYLNDAGEIVSADEVVGFQEDFP